MRVLQINSVCGTGSTGRIAADIHSILKELGHESYIAYGRKLCGNYDPSIRIGSDLDNYLHVALTRAFDRHGQGSKKATGIFAGRIAELDPDIIHLHNIHGYYINIEVLFEYLKSTNKPVVWTLHDCWPFTGHCAYFDYAGCDKWKTGCGGCPQKRSYPASLFADNSEVNYYFKKKLFTGLKNLTLVTPSIWLAGLVKESFLKEYPVEVINNGIDTGVFKPLQSDFRDRHNIGQKFIILGVANIWSERKGFRYFTELSGRIGTDEIIVLVGLDKKLRRQLPQNIIGIERTDSISELAEIYSAADVFVNPTLEDNFPTTNLEALACGTPVITFDTGGSAESVDAETGYVLQKGDIEGILEKIEIIKRYGKSMYSEKAVRRAADLYDRKARYLQYIDLYKRVSGWNK